MFYDGQIRLYGQLPPQKLSTKAFKGFVFQIIKQQFVWDNFLGALFLELPKTISMYCKNCKQHTPHKLKQFKSAAARAMSKGQRKHERRYKHGYGGKSKFVIKVKKQTKKPVFVAECSVCKKKQYKVIPKRMKKAEFKS